MARNAGVSCAHSFVARQFLPRRGSNAIILQRRHHQTKGHGARALGDAKMNMCIAPLRFGCGDRAQCPHHRHNGDDTPMFCKSLRCSTAPQAPRPPRAVGQCSLGRYTGVRRRAASEGRLELGKWWLLHGPTASSLPLKMPRGSAVLKDCCAPACLALSRNTPGPFGGQNWRWRLFRGTGRQRGPLCLPPGALPPAVPPRMSGLQASEIPVSGTLPCTHP